LLKKFVDAVEKQNTLYRDSMANGLVAKLLRLIPAALWDRLTKNAPHKARDIQA
jgi:hypothetical protein